MQLVEVNEAEQAAPKGGRTFHLEFEVRVIGKKFSHDVREQRRAL